VAGSTTGGLPGRLLLALPGVVVTVSSAARTTANTDSMRRGAIARRGIKCRSRVLTPRTGVAAYPAHRRDIERELLRVASVATAVPVVGGLVRARRAVSSS
jgi:hypothetical protein